ncbi:histidine kinase dimerization/phospho-acceptor domain-containing protein [Priestia megaterium]
MDKSGHEVVVIVTRNLSSVVMAPLYNFIFTIELVLPWYIITVSIFTYTTVSRVFRTLGKGIDSSLAIIEDNNYKGRLEVSERNGREINGIKTKINVVLDRMDNLVNSNIESLQDVSHEVNTHLTAIKQSIDMIKMYGEKNPKLAMTKLDTIDENIQRTTAIMTTILELARLDQEVACTSAEEHNVKELIESFVNHYRKVFPDFHFFTHYCCESPKLYIQKEHFYIGLKPIIENAAKYSSDSRYISISVKGEYSPTSPLYISIKTEV